MAKSGMRELELLLLLLFGSEDALALCVMVLRNLRLFSSWELGAAIVVVVVAVPPPLPINRLAVDDCKAAGGRFRCCCCEGCK
jgi:hypothetical protein